MTEYYLAWQKSLAQRDEAYLALFAIMVSVAAGYVLIRWLPFADTTKKIFRSVYEGVILVLYLVTIAVSIFGVKI